MTWKNTATAWGPVSKLFHWLIVLLILGQATLGLTMGDAPSGPGKIQLYAVHKSIGITILALAALRLLWRLLAGAPDTVPGTPRWQDRAARLVHALLYVLLFAVPLTGWVLNSAAGFPLQWFGLVNLPAIVGENHDLHEAAESAHELLFWALATLAAGHAAAAAYHHVFLGDATLARMLPRGWLRTAEAAGEQNG